MIYVWHTESPLGRLTLTCDGEAVTEVAFEEERYLRDRSGAIEEPHALLLDAERQLHEYFGKWRQSFDLPLRPQGTEFQREIWRLLGEIPYGETLTYRELASRFGNEKAVRAVGLANGRNPIGVMIPCHRVIGANGDLTGYGGGLWRKEYLLTLEGAMGNRPPFTD
ncbi:MAG: methylated-DNA--[protein]-cysteine S-methyltransferase [Acidobacteria bacterium]|nr:methylated-DNA--[protein]-cysteine S-methyltransferase [Acidobacteriota bacterium]